MKFLVFDTETTGLRRVSLMPATEQPRIIEFACVLVEKKKIIHTYSQLINPTVYVSKEITEITGLKAEDVKDMPVFSAAIAEISTLFTRADIAVAHNLEFDRQMIDHECALIGETFPWPSRAICSVQEYFHVKQYRMNLQTFYLEATGKELLQTHRALDDVIALHEALSAIGFYDALEGA